MTYVKGSHIGINFALYAAKGGFEMKKIIKKSQKKLVVVGLIFCLIVLCSTPGFASKEVCEKALARCGVDAVVAGLFSGPQAFLSYYAGCFMGYSWCLKYYDPEG
jgi:hypothetical protein